MSITDHPSMPAGTSQCSSILAELESNVGEWVTLPRLHAVSGSMAVHSRINDLRQRGYSIGHKNQRVGRMVHSFYCLSPGPLPLL